MHVVCSFGGIDAAQFSGTPEPSEGLNGFLCLVPIPVHGERGRRVFEGFAKGVVW